jgi:hypothetical protein
MASTATTNFAWAITLIKGSKCETDGENMERRSANVRCCLVCTEYVKMKGRRRSTQRGKRRKKDGGKGGGGRGGNT